MRLPDSLPGHRRCLLAQSSSAAGIAWFAHGQCVSGCYLWASPSLNIFAVGFPALIPIGVDDADPKFLLQPSRNPLVRRFPLSPSLAVYVGYRYG